jgi:hypothetical protein
MNQAEEAADQAEAYHQVIRLTRIPVYLIILLTVNFYFFKYDLPFVGRQIWLFGLILLTELLYTKRKTKLFYLSMSYLLLSIIVNFLIPYLYYNALSSELSKNLYLLRENYILDLQLIYLYTIVHLSVYSLVKYRKEPSLRIILFTIPTIILSLTLGHSLISLLINSVSFIVIANAYIRERFNPMAKTSHKELLLLMLYFLYSLSIITEFLEVEFIGYDNIFIIYTIILWLAVPVFFLDKIKAESIFFNKALKLAIALCIMSGIIIDAAVVFKTQHIVVSVVFALMAIGISTNNLKEVDLSDFVSGKR